MKTALKIGLFIFWIIWVAFVFWRFDDPWMNAGALVLSALMMVGFYFFYDVFLPAVVKTIWRSTKRRSEQ